jgi:hypothetical protein
VPRRQCRTRQGAYHHIHATGHRLAVALGGIVFVGINHHHLGLRIGIMRGLHPLRTTAAASPSNLDSVGSNRPIFTLTA